ncbi:MAG: FkbM family methyltransferase [Pseudomonadota bacterium]
MLSRNLAYLFRPYIRRELPGWGRIYRALGIAGVDNLNPKWRDAPKRETRNKRTGHLMELDLSDDTDRETYFLGRYYDIEVQLLLDEILKEGDTCIDIGANVGHFSLYSSHRVGRSGQVLAFEPQPDCCKKIEHKLSLNNISNVELHNLALGNTSGSLTLNVLGGGSIMAAIAIDPEIDTFVRESYEIPVARGDDVFPEHLDGDVFIKIDVEGYELFALQGMTKAIDRWKPAFLLEVERRYLERAGVSVEALFEFLLERDYSAYDVDTEYLALGKHRLALSPIPDIESYDEIGATPDLLWLPPGDTRITPSKFFRF